MDIKNRATGYYWVKMPDDDVNPGWKIALWHDNNGGDDQDWCWHSSAFDTKHYDWFFDEINENRIPEPGEKESILLGFFSTVIEQGYKFSYDPVKNEVSIFDKPRPRIISVTAAWTDENRNKLDVATRFEFTDTSTPIRKS